MQPDYGAQDDRLLEQAAADGEIGAGLGASRRRLKNGSLTYPNAYLGQGRSLLSRAGCYPHRIYTTSGPPAPPMNRRAQSRAS